MFRFIKINKAKCLYCNDIVISPLDSPSKICLCICKKLKISGGSTSLIRSGIQNKDYQELSNINFEGECPSVNEDVQDPPPEQEKLIQHIKNRYR